MKISMIGCGKLGFPCALVAATKHDVVGYDVLPATKEILRSRRYPHRETGAQELLEVTTFRIVDTVEEAIVHADVVLVAVQTPHGAEYEGITRMPDTRADFSYETLRAVVGQVAEAAKKAQKHIALVVISTVLPGTSERELYPLLNEYTHYAYTPYFIAMGTTCHDFANPEFVLLGSDDTAVEWIDKVRAFYGAIHSAEIRSMSVKSAEATKLAYNVFLGMKLLAANAFMEIAHKTGANVDDITDALSKATNRVVSSKYMKAGMGDGGGCLTPGSMVYTERGPRPISTIWPGDKVLSSDGTFRAVIDNYKRPYKGPVYAIRVDGVREAPSRFTPEHPLAVSDSWTANAYLLEVGSRVQFPETLPPGVEIPTQAQQILSVERESYEGTVYNLNVEGTHQYVTSAGIADNCHPRDQIALSWLAEKLNLSYDLFGTMVRAREAQTEWLAKLCVEQSVKKSLPIVVLGKAYKRGTNLTVGSPAVLLKNMLDEHNLIDGVSQWDPYVDPPREFAMPAVFIVATDHDEFFTINFLEGSVVIDPWGKMVDRAGVEVIRVGRV